MSRRTCSKCGLYNNALSKYCNRCGTSLLEYEINSGQYIDYQMFINSKNALSEKYILLEELGHGGMAVVYKALQKNLSRIVALKIIKSSLLNDAESLARFHDEAKIAGSLNHPNIITIFDYGTISGVHYIAMEFVEGDTLFHTIQLKGPLSEKTVIKYTYELAHAIQYLNDRDLVHQDVKSSNIIISQSGNPILMDFGIASLKSIKIPSKTQNIIGTPEYMSPEQIRGEKPDERSDLYSLGIVIYESLTKSVPFKGDTFQKTIDEINNIHPPAIRGINPGVSQKFEKIVLKLLNKKAEDRYQSGNELISALNRRTPNFTIDRQKILSYSIVVLLIFIFLGAFYLMYPTITSTKNKTTIEETNSPFQKKESQDSNNKPNKINGNQTDKGFINDTTKLIIKVPAVKEVVPIQPELDQLRETGDNNLKRGNFEKAQSEYSKILKIDPENLYAREKLKELEKYKSDSIR